MAEAPTVRLPQLVWLEKNRGMILPMGAMTLIFVLLVPLPTALLDFLLVINITVAAVVLLTVMYVKHPLELSSFPSLLLGLTLFRLVLNVATTRLILTQAGQSTAAAGQVIEVFGNFVAAGTLAVGVIIFAILAIIQFVVITKGATRIAEVAARFTLDGLPGKQMAIDADLNAGIIDDREARRRREEVTAEADFYGAMDGSAKFVRGDAIAGLIITFVNVIGGIYVGMVEQDMGIMEALEVFTRLSIGDGLVAAIPAFIISIGAGLLVTRSNSRSDFGEDMIAQLTSKPIALVLAAVFLGFLSFTPLPKMPLILLAAGLASISFVMTGNRKKEATAAATKATTEAAAKPQEKVETLLSVDPMELEVGYGLVKLVDRKQGGDLLDRITNIRRQSAGDLGIIVPPIRVRDHLKLEPNGYVIKLRGVEVAAGKVMPDHLMAIDNGMVSSPIVGIDTKEPAFGLPATWITDEQRADAEQRSYTVVPCTSVLATHLTEVVKQHADELLTRQQTHRLLDALKEKSPKAVEEVVPDIVSVGLLQQVLQNLLRERIAVRDLESILETLSDWAPRTKDNDVLTEYARHALARTICQMYKDDRNVIRVVTLDPKIEDLVNANIERSERGSYLSLSPDIQAKIIEATRIQIEQASSNAGGATICILCSPQIRLWMRRLIEPALPMVPVLSFNEIVRGVEVSSLGIVVLGNGSENLPG